MPDECRSPTSEQALASPVENQRGAAHNETLLSGLPTICVVSFTRDVVDAASRKSDLAVVADQRDRMVFLAAVATEVGGVKADVA